MNLLKLIVRKRQALRLHIEVMKTTDKSLQQRIRNRKLETLSFTSAVNARHHLKDRIAMAERELQVLEKEWVI